MQTLLNDYGPFFELAGVASIFGWTTCLALGLGLCAPDRALARGVFGILMGGVIFGHLNPHPDPLFDGYPMVTSFAGTCLVVFTEGLVKRAQESLASRKSALPPALRRYHLLADRFSPEVSGPPRPPGNRVWKRRTARRTVARAR